MELTQDDRKYLKSIGHLPRDLGQIETASWDVVLTFYKEEGARGRKISQKKAMSMLGREKYLAGLGRAAFHRTAMQDCPDGGNILFEAW